MNKAKLLNERQKLSSITIVGIGASAKRLAALKTLFHHMPVNSGLAFVVIVRLIQQGKSPLADLLQPHVKMPVHEVTTAIQLEPDHVYVIPPGYHLKAIDTHLRLSKAKGKPNKQAPIDHFFRTLATTYDGNTIGVILTGMGTDGMLGIKEIKGKGGLTIAQAPKEAEKSEIPPNATSNGFIDHILPLAEIPNYILHFANPVSRDALLTEEKQQLQKGQKDIQQIILQVRTHTGLDFSSYKYSFLLRCIQHRMQQIQLENLSEYPKIVSEQPQEAQALSDEFLIRGTNFFRDPRVFRQLSEEVVPSLFDYKGPEDTIRVWSVGCATGEEAYSLAILLLEEAANHKNPPKLQIFATDIDERSLQMAREGFYPRHIEVDVYQEHLNEYFIKENGGYQIRKKVRERVVFALHNLLTDPPFAQLDLVLCRNVLIYLQPQVQIDTLKLFHYALKSDGYLLLGTTEGLNDIKLFYDDDQKNSLYRKRNIPTPMQKLPVFVQKHKLKYQPVTYEMIHRQIIEQNAPPSLLISSNHKVVHFSKDVGQYLVHSEGEKTNDIFKLVRKEFHIDLTIALQFAIEKEMPSQSRAITLQLENQTRQVVLTVSPAREKIHSGLFMVTFNELPQPDSAEVSEQVMQLPFKRDDDSQDAVQKELDHNRYQLYLIIQEYQSMREQMRISNEELQSVNEELRATLDELAVNKEELLSKNKKLSQISSDLQHLLMTTDIATLFLDRELRILKYTPPLEKLFNVKATDLGRFLTDLTHHLNYDELIQDAQKVLDKLILVEHEIQDVEQRWYLTRMLPYRSIEDRIEGVVVTFVDISAQKKVEEELRLAKNDAEHAAKAKEEFLALMSHEIRTPLNAIVGLSALLLQQNPLPLQLENLNTLKFSAEHLRMLVNDILDYSKIQANKVTINVTEVHLPDLVHSLQKAHELRAAEQGNELMFHVDKQIPEIVHTDRIKLAQVLNNLIGNAVKFTRKGVIQVEVSLNSKENHQLWLGFSVSDTGEGIPEEKLSQVFEAFSQADVSTTRTYEGTGLGLSITRSLLKLMGGQIEVESKEGVGTRFFFTLPVKECLSTTTPTSPLPKQTKDADLLHIKILLVEDTAINRIIIMEFLKEWWQLVPDEAMNGQQAVAKAQKQHYDLILMDIHMPEMDGYQATKAIRNLPDPHYQQVAIIALTADTMAELRKHSEAELFTDVLIKPCDPRDLQEKIIRYAPKIMQSATSSEKGLSVSQKTGFKEKHSKRRHADADTLLSLTAGGISFGNLEALFENDEQDIKMFLKEMQKELIAFQHRFSTALANRDSAALASLKHEMIEIINLMNLEPLETWIERCQILIKKNASQPQFNAARQKVKAIVAQIIASVKEYLEK